MRRRGMCRYASAVEGLDSGPQAACSAVEGVVVGGKEEVESGFGECVGPCSGGVEAWVARVRGFAEGSLEVYDGEVGAFDIGSDVGEASLVIPPAVGPSGGVDLRLMLHGVADKKEFRVVIAQQQREQVYDERNNDCGSHVSLSDGRPEGCSA